jgi:hypothetical protein
MYYEPINRYNYDLPRLYPVFRLIREVHEISQIYETMGDIWCAWGCISLR